MVLSITLIAAMQFCALTSHNVDGIAITQRKISETANVRMNTFLAVRMRSRRNTANTIKKLPSTPKIIKIP